MIELNKVYNEPCIETLKRMDDDSIDCVVTSPPYYALRTYANDLVKLKRDAPQWVCDKLKELNILPYDYKK